jgi:hypothetical protein
MSGVLDVILMILLATLKKEVNQYDSLHNSIEVFGMIKGKLLSFLTV